MTERATQADDLGPTRDAASNRNTVVEHIRRRILASELPPGERLPTRQCLKASLGVCMATLQQAFDQLEEDGFIYSKARQGTFVSEKPPHLFHYGLVLPPDAEQQWTGFTAGMLRAITRMEKATSRRFSIYRDVDEHTDTPSHQRLLADLQAHRLAGLILRGAPALPLARTPLLVGSSIPKVAIHADGSPDLPAVTGNYRSFIDKALDYFSKGRSRQRVAFINNYAYRPPLLRHLAEGARARGMQIERRWIHEVQVPGTRSLVEMMLSIPAPLRPDALLIGDENLTDEACIGLVAAGLKPLVDIDVVAHCNFPAERPALLPMKRLGWSIDQYLEAFVSLIDRQRRGEKVPELIEVEPLFEEEVQRS